MGGSVDWTAFTWDAFATLATGLAAVGAAVVIGLRQTNIARRQNDLIGSQSEFSQEIANREYLLRQQSFRLDLLAERRDVLSDFRRIWGIWFQDAALSDEEWSNLRTVLHHAQLVYSRRLSEQVAEVLKEILAAKLLQRRASSAHERGDEEKAQGYLDKSIKSEEKIMALMPRLLDDMIEETRVIEFISPPPETAD